MKAPRLTRKALSGLNTMATLSESWREADADESLDDEQITCLEAAEKWLRAMTQHRNDLASGGAR